MSANAMSRRNMFRVGVCALTGTALLTEAASGYASDGDASANEAVIRKWYKAWEKKDMDWGPFDALLADDFTFSSTDGNDHISKAAFKKNCWDNQIAFIKESDLELVTVKGDEALVKYLCHTMNGKSFRNVEYLRLRNQRIEEIECYFGGTLTYPSAVSSQKG
jgi:ketosteroid isomerase-like protein